jgi:hypothetical protein
VWLKTRQSAFPQERRTTVISRSEMAIRPSFSPSHNSYVARVARFRSHVASLDSAAMPLTRPFYAVVPLVNHRLVISQFGWSCLLNSAPKAGPANVCSCVPRASRRSFAGRFLWLLAQQCADSTSPQHVCSIARHCLLNSIRHPILARLTEKMQKKLGKKAGKKPGKKLGQAEGLLGKAWAIWIKHILHAGQSWVYAVVILTHLLCCRVTEVLQLKGSDFDWKNERVKFGAFKYGTSVVPNAAVSLSSECSHNHGLFTWAKMGALGTVQGSEMHKPMLPASVKVLKKLRKGVSRVRTRDRGALGKTRLPDTWCWTEGPLFPSDRSDADSTIRNKDAVSKVPCEGQAVHGQVRCRAGRHGPLTEMQTRAAQGGHEVVRKRWRKL